MSINVNRSISDPFYRYKMPKILAKVEGRGNGIRTVIANMSDIAKALERPPMYPTKYFGCELGAQTNFDSKNDRYIVNGDHDASKLQDVLDGFIKKFVLCPSCDNPETTLSVRKNQILSKCKACGHAYSIDNKHKLSTFIIKNPPKKDIDFSRLRENGRHKDEDDVIIMDRASPDDDDDDWAPAPEKDHLCGAIGKLVVSADLSKSLDERLEMFEQMVLKDKATGSISDGKAFLDEAERLDIKAKAPVVLAMTLLDSNVLKDDQLKKYRTVFLRFTLNDKKAQRYMLGGMEKLIMSHSEILLPYAAHILKALYDHDIVEEETIFSWAEKPSSKYVTKTNARKIIEKCEKVIKWLKEAEEESSDSENGEGKESDDDVQFDARAATTGSYVEKTKAAAEIIEPIIVRDNDGEEISIDDI